MLAKLNSHRPKGVVGGRIGGDDDAQTFASRKAEIERLLDDASSVDVQTIAARIVDLQSSLTEHNSSMSAYDSRKSADAICSLRARLEQIAPKKVFSFSRAPAATATIVDDRRKSNDDMPIIMDEQPGLNHRSNCVETLTYARDADVLLSELDGCTITLRESACTLHLSAIRNCTIIAAPVRTSIFVENCYNSTLVVACQQLRVHSSTRMRLYVHITSTTILEQCHDIQVAPYRRHSPLVDAQLIAVGLAPTINNWDVVQDFDAPNPSVPSPNWTRMPNDDNVTSD